MELFYKNKYISLFLSVFVILFVVISCYTNVYADNQGSGSHFGSDVDLSVCNKIYDGFDFSDTISKHESFYFSDSVGNKHAVARVGTAWICLFGTRATFNGSQDEQLNYYLSYYAYTGYKSISNSFGSLLSSKLGTITKGGYTFVENVLSSNISNVASGISYNESDDSISFDSSSIDKLREEIKKYYYNSIGLKEKKSNGTVTSIIDSSDFRACFEYEEDYASVFGFKNYKYCLKTYYGFYYFFNDLPDYIYVSNDSNNDRFLSTYDNWTEVTWRFRTLKSDGSFGYFQPVKEDTVIRYDYTLKVNVSDMYFWYTPSYYDWVLRPDWNNSYSTRCELYSKDKVSLKFWSSYSALYNYLHGDQNAYLSSKIEEAGQDISMNIKDMDANLCDKMDTLIDTINSKKDGLSADELQDAINKGLDDLNKNTEDIKDNTSDILDILKEQNQILLDILGVTTNIYEVVKENDSKEKTYNINYVQSVFNSMFKGLKNAVLYGENTVRDDVSEDTDNIDSIVSDIPPDKKNYHNGLFGRFPFSVPYQLFDWLQALYVDPVAPKFTLSYAYLFTDLGYETNNFEFIIDLGDEKYSKWIELVRSGEKLSFIIYMAIATYHRFKNEI